MVYTLLLLIDMNVQVCDATNCGFELLHRTKKLYI